MKLIELLLSFLHANRRDSRRRVCRLIFLLSALVLVDAPTARAASSLNQERLVSANNAFAFKLLQQLAREQPGSNILISPYGVSTLLQMADNGARGRTKEEIEKVLETTSLDLDALNRANRLLSQGLKPGPTNSTVLEIANALWYRKQFELKPEFTARLAEFFQANIAGLDFADPRSADTINTWANEKTHGKIPNFMAGPLQPEDRLLLANAVYFKGAWANPFNKERTMPGAFHLGSGQEKQIPMMTQFNHFFYQVGTELQAVCLRYEGQDFAMSILLPAPNSSITRLLPRLDAGSWEEAIWPKFRSTAIRLSIPRFKQNYRAELQKPTEALGVSLAFHNRKADFSPMSAEPLYVNRIWQNATIEVDEQGTTAAAASGLGMPGGSLPSMVVDRPFLFLVHHLPTRSILLMGVVYEPEDL